MGIYKISGANYLTMSGNALKLISVLKPHLNKDIKFVLRNTIVTNYSTNFKKVSGGVSISERSCNNTLRKESFTTSTKEGLKYASQDTTAGCGRSTNLTKEEKLAKTQREKTPAGKQEKEPLAPHPGGVNPNTGEIGGPRGPEPTRYGD